MITIDLRNIHSSGIGTYLRNLVPLVISAFPKAGFNLLGKKQSILGYKWSCAENISVFDCNPPIYSIAEQFEFVRKTPSDTKILWYPHYNIPVFYQGKLLVTIHDTLHIAMPELLPGIHKRLYAKFVFGILKMKKPDILTVSHFTEKSLIELTGIKKSRIKVAHLGVDKEWFNIPKINSPHKKPFFLFVGNVKPHKNLLNLIKAFQKIENEVDTDLIIIGKKEGFITGDREAILKAKNLNSRITFTGYIEDDMLKQYVLHAKALILPSFHEGFGLPCLEAMACGCPVLASNAASLPEVCGEAALYCDPYCAEDIAEKLKRINQNNSLRKKLQQNGYVRAKQFTWEKCAQKTVAVISRMLPEHLR
jgi:glycosyltransferase involved in cell wall biosynthesis